MSIEHKNALANSGGSAEPKPQVHPAPGFVWMILPVALLALLAYLSR